MTRLVAACLASLAGYPTFVQGMSGFHEADPAADVMGWEG